MNRPALRLALFRLRATFRRDLGGYVALVLFVGLMGGVGVGAVGAARRTQSSFPAFLASTNPSDLTVSDADSNDANLEDTFAQLAHVNKVESAVAPPVFPLGPDGKPGDDLFQSGVLTLGTVNGLFFDEDRVTVTEGRMADPQRPDECVMTGESARLLHYRVGDVAHLGIFTSDQENSPDFASGSIHPAFPIDVKVVGIVVFNTQVVQDDVDRVPTYVLLTPAFTRSAIATLGSPGALVYALQLDHGARDVAAVEAEIKQAVPDASVVSIASIKVATAERAIRPESIALGVFGGIAVLAALLIAGQVIGRQLRLRTEELETFRALGADVAMTLSDGLLGIEGSILAGTLLAVGVAAGLSPLSPLGPVRSVDPSPGFFFDWTALGLGALVLFVGLSASAWVMASRSMPHRRARRRSQGPSRLSGVARVVASSGLSVPAATGIRFALEPGSGRNTVPVRSAIVGTVLAMVIVVATVTFGASLNTLVSHPALYGWNWDYELRSAYAGVSNIPEQHAAQLLDDDPDVAAWAGVYFDSLQLDGHTIPVLAETPNAAVGPPILSGHGLQASDQIVLGANTLAELHKHIGDTVELGNATSQPTPLTIVGTATLPAIGITTNLHLEIGTGAVLADTLIPTSDRGYGDQDGPEAIFVRLRSDANPTKALDSLRHLADSLFTPGDGAPSVVPVQRPAEIVNYRALDTTPDLLGASLAVGALVALALTLTASVRRRRRDLALLRAIGFTGRQLSATVAWQSTVAATIGTVLGVPAGLVLGRSLWDQFAEQVHVVPASTVPGLSIGLITVGAIVLANVVAALPGRQAARTTTAHLLRAD